MPISIAVVDYPTWSVGVGKGEGVPSGLIGAPGPVDPPEPGVVSDLLGTPGPVDPPVPGVVSGLIGTPGPVDPPGPGVVSGPPVRVNPFADWHGWGRSRWGVDPFGDARPRENRFQRE
jgi:hypothetical protein